MNIEVGSSLELSSAMSSIAAAILSSFASVLIVFAASLVLAAVLRAEVASRTCARTSGESDSNSRCVRVTCIAIAQSYTSVAIFPSYTGGRVLYAGSDFFGGAGFGAAAKLRFAGGIYVASGALAKGCSG